MKKTIMVDGMACGHCEAAVKEALAKIEGVEKVEVDLDTKEVVIESSRELEAEKIEQAIDDIGFEVI